MSLNVRQEAIRENLVRPVRAAEYPKGADGRAIYLSEIFGQNVFGLTELKRALPKPIFSKLVRQIKGHQNIDRPTADAVAHAAKIWAMDKGATHFTHWFQPQTESTAEKHDSFLDIRQNEEGATYALDSFSGSQLLQSEPDASSFPSGGMRSTFEARGYTIWDVRSPMFLRTAPNGTATLCVPSVFISYNGEALDEKTILLRASEALNEQAIKLLRLIGDHKTGNVYSTLGVEQEYFLVDRALYSLRPDLKQCGRTLLGHVIPRLQEMDAHYFGRIPTKVLSIMSEVELELYKLGVPIKTRHNEVAPAQFETAPIFEEATIAVDHNLLTMEILHKVAHRHGFKALFHEKPFKGVNGSGKHCNWSMATDLGENLLDPTANPEKNPRFLLFLVASLYGVYKYQGILRASIASASNEHRLGAHEAPPGIISAFLGEHLTETLDSIEQNRPLKEFSKPHIQSIKVGGTELDLKVATLPAISRDLTDRNRTSPFAFTGNKFEFRAVGAKQSPSFPVAMVSAVTAAALKEINAELEKLKGSKAAASEEDILTIVKTYIAKSKPIRFEGNGYSQAWQDEANARGLLNIKSCPVALKQLLEPANQKMLIDLDIYTEAEVASRYSVLIERYVKDVMIEATTLKGLVGQSILPSVFEYRKSLIDSVLALKQVNLAQGSSPEELALKEVSDAIQALSAAYNQVIAIVAEIEAVHDEAKQGDLVSEKLLPAMLSTRKASDTLESITPDKYWPLPRYTDILFNI